MTNSTTPHTDAPNAVTADAVAAGTRASDPTGPPSAHASVIRSVTIRVAGGLRTECFAHHVGTAEQQVGVRAGDTLSYVHDPAPASAIARAFCDAAARARREAMPWSVSTTWLGLAPGTWAPTLMQRYADAPTTAVGFQVRREISGQIVPAHVWVRVGPVLWQVCDCQAADRLAYVWSSCARLLTGVHNAPGVEEPNARPVVPRASRASGGPERPARRGEPARPPSRIAATLDPRGDAELLAAFTGGDAEALGLLWVRHERHVRTAVQQVMPAHRDAEDVMQEAWSSVIRSAGTFNGEAAVSTWLWTIAHRAALDALRRAKVRAQPERGDSATRPEPAEASDALAHADAARVADQLLAVLSADQRRAVELVDRQGYDYPSAARLLGVPAGTVKSRVGRARVRMAAEAARAGLLDPT